MSSVQNHLNKKTNMSNETKILEQVLSKNLVDWFGLAGAKVNLKTIYQKWTVCWNYKQVEL